ncbi:uncharacterized protein LOC118400899 isoform X4 [Oncorhynchus keta]|uniref:uncharacterized protein LOC118400899 isoform X4 n=1 Tax=Oncorhynchus keta TaxID=8018 RepID=UPI00227BDA3C|nr:uncharacterized protein LOC118400899 isoform X4 [Oncorhynchus keta]
MEIENGAARGVLLPVLPGSEPFDNSILPPLQNMYMYEESKQSFRYNSAFLIKNTTLQERYEAFRTERRGMGYSEEELEESYGFLLFDDKNKANKLGETGVIPGHSTCSTLGDPSKGVYVSKYSDCLDLNRWYHGKSGYIAIIRLTKGRVRDVTENYTVNYTPPSNGFDCHVSEQLSAVSANTSSFLAFERTQYYMYELPGGGADSTVQPPSHACPFAIVSFSYWDTKTPASEDQEKSEEEKTVFHYYPWRGQLHISSQVYHVGLKSSTGPLIPAKLPTVMAVDGAIKMSDLRQKLPKAMFETCFIGEVSLEGMGWSLYELAPSEADDTSLSQLTQELKEKDLALVIQLNDSGFLILLHSSHFLTYEDAGSNKPEVLQGMFVFPDSRAIQRDTKICSKKPSLSPEGLQVVPALNYAETEVEKCLPEQSGELRGLLEQHIQSYAALIHPGLTISPSREASIFPDQFDVPDALKYLYSTPKWTEMGWKCLKSYFHQPGSFELSVSRATELLAAGREERGDEPDDDVYYCLSSPEGPPMTPASLGGPEEEQSGGQSPGDTDTYISNALAVSTEDFEKPGMTKADSNAPNKRVEEEKTLSSKEVQDKVQHVQPKEVQEKVPSDLTKPAVPAGDFGKPVLKKADSNAPGTTLIPKEVQKELPYDLSQPVVLADDSGKPGKNKAVPGVGVEDEGTHLKAEEVQVDRQKEVKEDMLSDLSQPAENLRKAGPAALGKADCKAPEVGVANEGTNLHLKEVQKDMPSGLSQPAVSQEELKKPGPALATKPNIKAVETGVEDKGGDLPKKEVQEEVPCDLSQFAVSANVFAIAGMTVMTKATEVTEVSTSPVSGDLPTVLVITATEGTATVVPHNENFGLINTESITKNSSSLPPAKVQERGGSALNGQRGKANEVNNLSTSDWRKRPRKRRRFSGLGKRVLRSSAADFEEEETEKGSLDSSKVCSLKKRKEMTDLVQLNPWKKKERMDVTQVRPLKMQRELMNLIQDLPLKKKKESKDSINFYPFKRKESVDLIHDGHPLKKKTDRWDLKAIISECGRIFVPHGSAVIAKDIESLKVMGKVIDHKQCVDEMMVEACIKVPQPIETGDEPGLELIKSDENKDPHIWSSDSKDHPPEVKMADVDKMASQKSSELVQNKDMDFPSLEKHKKNSQFVAISLSKLKTVFSRRGKKKTPLKPVSEDQMLPLDKKSKAGAGMESVHFSNSCKDTPDRTTGAAEVAKEQTFGLDPKFALALGLTPRELHNNAPKSPEKSDIPLKQDIQSRLDLVTPQATSDQMSEALPSSPSATITLTGRGSPLTMKCKPADSIRKKWWLHYHTPTSFEKEKVAQPISSQLLTLNPDVRRVVSRGRPRTVKKDTSDASCPPADALTLLADLALSTSNDKVLDQQPDHLALQQQECCPSLLISDNSVKDGGSPHESDGEPESVLHALLKHPSVARLKLPPQSPSPKGLVVGSGERVVLVSQEHSYSLPPSSSLLLGLSGSTLQVPISEGLQPHCKDMVYGDGTQAVRPFLCQEQDQNRKELGKESGVAPESMRKGIGRRQKFRRLRRFIEKDRSVQVTRLWKENYDFNSDSKFTNDPMDKTVIRALHGPWDFNIEDTNEQVQLIIHMWIGLFYSRSTARFFQADPSLLCMEEKDSTEVDHGMVQAQVTSETKTSSPAYIALSRIPEPDVLDRSNVGKKESQPLSLEPKALDISVKTTSTVLDFTVDTKDSPESKQRIYLKSPSVYEPDSGLHKEIISFHKQSTGLELKVYRDREDSVTSDKTSELDDDETNTHDNDSNGTLQNDVSPKRRHLESDGSYILLCEQAASVYINQEKVLETQRIDRGLEGKAKKEIQKEERSLDGEHNIARLQTMESKDVDEAQQVQDNDSVKTMSCTEVLGDGDLTNMADRVECNASEPRDRSYVAICDGSESKMHKAYPSVEDSVEAAKPEAVHVGKDTTNKEINAQPAGNDSIGKALKAMHDEKIPKDVSRDDGNSKNEVQTALQEGNDNGDEAQTALQEGNDNGDEAQTALQEGNDNGDEAQTALQEGNDNGDEAQTALQEGNDNGDEAQMALQEGNDNGDEAQTALQEGNDNGDEAQTALQEGNDNGDEAQTALQEGNDNGDEAQTALQEGNDHGDEAQTSLQEGNDNGDEAQTALQEGNDNGDEAKTALQEGNDNGDEAQTALQEGNDNGDEAQTALQEGNDNGDEAQMALQEGNDNGDEAQTALQEGNDHGDEAQTSLQEGNDNGDEAQTALQEGNDIGDEAQTALHEWNDNGDEAKTAWHEGNDNGDEAQTALQEGNDNGDEAQTALQEGNDNGDEAQTALQEGNDNGDEAQTALQEGNDNGDEAQTALQEGNDNGDEAQTALQEGNDNGDEAQTALQEGNDNGDEAQTAWQEGNDNGDEAQTAWQEGTDNGDEALPAVNYEKESGDKAAPAVCGGNNSVAETPPEISHNENDSQKETPSVVHGGNDSTLPVKLYSKLYIDEEPTDEVQPMEQVGNVSVGTTRVLLEMQVEIKSNDEVLTTRVFPLCDGNTPFVGEFDTPIQSKDVSGEAKTTAVETDFNGIRDSKDQKRISMPGQSKSDIDTQGPRHSQDETSEVLTGQVEIPLIGAGIPREDISHTDVLHSHSQTSECAQIEIPFIGVELPFIGVETDSKDIMHTEVHDTYLCQKDTPISSVCQSDNLFSGEMFRIVSKATESVSRCPTPIVDDGYIPIPDIDSGCLVNCDASGVGKPLSRCPTPTQDEPPFVTELSYDHHTPKTVFLPDLKDTNSPNLNSGFALIENEKAYCEPHEPSIGSSPSSVENMLHEFRKSSNNHSKPNNLEAIGNQFSQLWTEPRKKPIATSTPLNTPYTSSKEKNDYSPYSNMRLTPAEQDLYALSSHDSLHRFPASYPKTHSTVTQKAAFSVPSTHLEVLSNDTTERILTRDLSEIALEGDTNLCPASTEIIIQSIRQNIPGVSGPTAASQNLSGPNFTEPHPYSQQLAMAVNLSKSEGSRGEYSWKEGQTNIDPMSSDVVKSKQTAAPVHLNTNPHPYNTPYVPEMRRQIASLQDYVMDESEEPAVEQDNIESSLETNWISDDQHASNTSQLNKTKLDFINSLREYQQWDKREFDDVLDFSKQGTSSSVTFQSEESNKIFTRMEENKQDWLKYCRSERSGNTSKSQIDLDDEHKEVSSFAKPCLVTVLDHKGNRITYENYPVPKPSTSTHTWTAPNPNRQGSSSFLEFSKRWDDTHNTDESDLTQSSVDLETLIFSERMNQMLKRKRKSSSSRYNRSKHHRSSVEERASSCSPAVTVHFSSLQEQESSEEHWEGLPSLAGQKLKIDMPERKGMPEETDRDMPEHLQKLSYTKGSEMTHVNVSDLVAESFKAYHAMMTEVCAGRKYPHRTERREREEAKRNSLPKSRTPSKDKDFCGQMKKDMYDDSLHDNLNSVVKQSCKNKFRFYILVTSDDPFFNETKELLEAEGHITVEQSQFCLGKDSPSSPLYIILRNEDIAEHICEVPHLLELKKSQNVLFAGIDRPDDIVNLTHQELFSKGGFVVFEGAALDTLSLSNIKKMSGFLEGLSKKGKWKWLLHYKDSRKLKESARSSAEAQGKKSFMDNCQEAGMVEVLPYHECDVISRTRPNYLHCLVRLQVQNVSARLPVFITDTTADKAFAKHGIFTMNINSFLLISQSDTCTIS